MQLANPAGRVWTAGGKRSLHRPGLGPGERYIDPTGPMLWPIANGRD